MLFSFQLSLTSVFLCDKHVLGLKNSHLIDNILKTISVTFHSFPHLRANCKHVSACSDRLFFSLTSSLVQLSSRTKCHWYHTCSISTDMTWQAKHFSTKFTVSQTTVKILDFVLSHISPHKNYENLNFNMWLLT